MKRERTPTNYDGLPSPSFEDELNAWLEHKIARPITFPVSDHDFDKWERRAAKEAREVLASLYVDHDIRPGAVLLILGAAKMWQSSAVTPNWGARRLRQILPSKKRKALAARLINDAVDCKLLGDLIRWNLGQTFADTDTACTQMHRVAQLLLSDEIKFLPRNSNASRDNELKVVRRVCAKRLCEFFIRIAGQPKHRMVGKLVRIVFSRWPLANPEDDTQEILDKRAEESVKKWTKHLQERSFDPVVSDALVVQEQDEVYLNRWREFRAQWVNALKESEANLKGRYKALIEEGIEATLDRNEGLIITDKKVARSEHSEWRMMVSRLAQGKRPFRD